MIEQSLLTVPFTIDGGVFQIGFILFLIISVGLMCAPLFLRNYGLEIVGAFWFLYWSAILYINEFHFIFSLVMFILAIVCFAMMSETGDIR